MNNTSLTYELRISLRAADDPAVKAALKQQIIDIFRELGEDSFVEGAVDNIEVDYNYDKSYEEQFSDAGGEAAPLSLYKYSLETLDHVEQVMRARLADRVIIERFTIDTEKWLHGWKENFHPFTTRKFVVHPPWEAPGPVSAELIPLEIEPGVAFGTGHHATTRLCLTEVENILEEWSRGRKGVAERAMLDVGTGTGILAIAAYKLGLTDIWGTDIDLDAVRAAQHNAEVNGARMQVSQGSFPQHRDGKKGWDLVMANILAVVLRKIFADLAAALAEDGRLVLSGLLEEDAPEFETLGKTHNLKLIRMGTEAGWACLVFGRSE
jgi:ribosomal protein L11 methyltransferase